MAGLAATSSVVGAPAPASMDTVVPAGAGRVSDRSEEFDGTMDLVGSPPFGPLINTFAPRQQSTVPTIAASFHRCETHCPTAMSLGCNLPIPAAVFCDSQGSYSYGYSYTSSKNGAPPCSRISVLQHFRPKASAIVDGGTASSDAPGTSRTGKLP